MEYSFLSEDGGISFSNNITDHDLLFRSIENLGYQNHFSFPKLLEILEATNRVEWERSGKPRFSETDIKDITNLLARISVVEYPPGTPKEWPNPDFLKQIDLNDPKYALPLPLEFPTEVRGKELSYTEVSKLVDAEIKKQKGVENPIPIIRITSSSTRIRLYILKDGVYNTISWINPAKGIGIGNKIFQYVLLYVALIQKYRKYITFEEATPTGIGAEKISVEEISGYFKNNNPNNISFKLYIQDGVSKVIPMSVLVNGASHIPAGGTRKADISLVDNGVETFWISFKDADYFKEAGSTKLASVGFPHYGPVTSLSNKLANDKVWVSIQKRFLSGLYKILPRMEIDKAEISGKNIISINGKPLDMSNSQHEIISRFPGAFVKLMGPSDNETKTKQRRIVYFGSSGFGAKLDFLDGTDETRRIAGKAIYGLDFELKSTTFGSENCQILMQSGTKLTVIQHTDVESIILKTDEKGHILLNPNLPIAAGSDPILEYSPVLGARYEAKNPTTFDVDNVKHLFLQIRMGIIPSGKTEGYQLI